MFRTIFQYLQFYFQKFLTSKYKIEGKCNQCGECCRNIVFMIDDNYVCDEKQFEALKKFEKKYRHFDIAGKNEKGVLLFRCQSLGEDNKCKDYVFRSVYCRAYPFVTDKIRLGGCETFDSCGFKIKVDKKFENYLK